MILLAVVAICGVVRAEPSRIAGRALQQDAEHAGRGRAARVDECAALGLTRGLIIELDPSALAPGREVAIDLPLGGIDTPARVERVLLTPSSVRTPGFVLYEHRDGRLVPVAAPAPRTLRGLVQGIGSARAAGGITPGGVSLAIDLPREDGSFERWWVEPLSPRVSGCVPGSHAVYRSEDIRRASARCEAVDAAPPDVAGGSFGARASTHYNASVAVEADFEYYARLGSVELVVERVELIYTILNLQYERDVDIRHTLSAIIVNVDPNDPYTQPDTGSMLGEMVQEWNAHRAGVPRDLAHLFTGKAPLAVIGTALIGVVCTSSAYAVSNVEFNAGNLASACDIVAHETGHNWGACHCACESPPYTMNPSILGINGFGSTPDECGTSTIASIMAHRDSRTCLDLSLSASDPPLNDQCGGAREVGPGVWAFSNRGAGSESASACVAMSADIWYRFVAPHDGTLTLSTCGTRGASGLDSAIAVLAGGCAGATLACSDAHVGQCAGGPPNFDAFVALPVVRSGEYFIRVGTSAAQPGATDVGFLTVGMSGCAPPSNDLCAGATPVGDGFFPFSTICAGTDGFVDNAPGCGAFGYEQTGSDVWFRYTPPCAGEALAEVCGASLDFDARLAIYYAPGGGCPGGPYEALACSDDECGAGPRLTFMAEPGDSFLVRVGGYNGARGSGVLTLRGGPCVVDLDDGTSTGLRDCAVDVNDLLYFLACFDEGRACADLDDNALEPPAPDGGVDINDLIYFLGHFESGC